MKIPNNKYWTTNIWKMSMHLFTLFNVGGKSLSQQLKKDIPNIFANLDGLFVATIEFYDLLEQRLRSWRYILTPLFVSPFDLLSYLCISSHLSLFLSSSLSFLSLSYLHSYIIYIQLEASNFNNCFWVVLYPFNVSSGSDGLVGDIFAAMAPVMILYTGSSNFFNISLSRENDISRVISRKHGSFIGLCYRRYR